MTNWPDLINTGFEFGAELFVLNNCRVLYKDKMVKGVSLLSTIFFALWGSWNIWYFPSLGQWASFYGGIGLVAADLLWIGMMLYYRNQATKIAL